MATSVCLPLPPRAEYQQQWDCILSNFTVANLFIIGNEDNAPTANVLKDATYIDSADDLPAATLVALAPAEGRYVQGDVSLVDFAHPEDAIYLFGQDNLPLSEDELGSRVPDHTVFVPTDTSDEMYSWQVYAVTAWDRKMKIT